jgi:predicted DNA-binding ribbon-helix-helix protein
MGVVSYGHTRDPWLDERHRRDPRTSDGEVSVGVGSASEDMTSTNKGRHATVKHSTVINGHKTSVSLEKEFWSALKEIAIVQGTTVSAIIGAIDLKRDHTNLCSALRLFVLDFYRKQLPPLG